MLSQKSDLALLRIAINELIDRIQEQQEHNDLRFAEHSCEFREVYDQLSWLTGEVKHLQYFAERNEELEFRVNSYSPDGDSNCNS